MINFLPKRYNFIPGTSAGITWAAGTAAGADADADDADAGAVARE